MLRKEINELLTETDAGKPMGEMFRQYWIPALLARELPEVDCPPVRMRTSISGMYTDDIFRSTNRRTIRSKSAW